MSFFNRYPYLFAITYLIIQQFSLSLRELYFVMWLRKSLEYMIDCCRGYTRKVVLHIKQATSTAKSARNAVGMAMFFPQKSNSSSDSSNLIIQKITSFLVETIWELPLCYLFKKGTRSDVLMGKLVYTHSLPAMQSLMKIWYLYQGTFFSIVAFLQPNWRFCLISILDSPLIKSLSIKRETT